MAFILKTDFPASVHIDILDALIRNNDEVIEHNAARTVDEMRAYLNGRYNVNAIFSAEGASRNQFLLRLAVTITLYYIYLAHNPRKLTQVMMDEFERAISTLEKIQKGTINPEGLPLPENPEDLNSGTGYPMQWGSSLQMDNDW